MTDDGIAVVPVLGPLMTRGEVLDLDSPGGEVGGLFDLVDRIGALRASSDRPLWAVAGEAALSAAHAIASAADRLYVTRTAEIGSIGIVAAHVDASGADAIAGRKWTLVHAGARKIDGNSHEPLSDRALAAIQSDVDALHAELCSLVARKRRMSPESVRGTEAAIWRGSRGIAAGFADRLGTLDQALADLAASLDPPPGRAARLTPTRLMQGTSMTDQTPTATAVQPAVTDPPASPAAPETPAETTTADTAAAAASAVRVATSPAPSPASDDATARLRAEFAGIASVAAQAGRLGVDIDAADVGAGDTGGAEPSSSGGVREPGAVGHPGRGEPDRAACP